MNASPKQIAYIKSLGRQLGLDETWTLATTGREHWASLRSYEASAAIKNLQTRIANIPADTIAREKQAKKMELLAAFDVAMDADDFTLARTIQTQMREIA